MKNKLTLLFLVQTDFSDNGKDTFQMWKTLLFSIIGGASQLATQAIANSVSGSGKIDWSHVGTASLVGVITTVGALFHPAPTQQN
jgi:hypothetical protein